MRAPRELHLSARARGCCLVTAGVVEAIPQLVRLERGWLHAFIRRQAGGG